MMKVMISRRFLVGLWGGVGLLWVICGSGDVRAGEVDVIGFLRRLQSRFVTLDARVSRTEWLVESARKQVASARNSALVAERESLKAKSQAHHAVQTAQRAKQSADSLSSLEQRVLDAEKTVQTLQIELASAKRSVDAAKKEAREVKSAVVSLQKHVTEQERVIQRCESVLSIAKRQSDSRGYAAGHAATFKATANAFFAGRWIPAGSFLMGSPAGEAGRDSDEGPQRSVRISRGFWMMESEVTQGLYKAVMGVNPSHFSSCGERCPVEKASWHDAALFANKLSEKAGLPKCFVCHQGICEGAGNKGSDYLGCKGWRLPTEAEWEYAARAGTTTPFHTGDCISTGQANYDGNFSNTNCGMGEYRRETIAVCSLARNAWGLCDMPGNVWEWVYDGYKNTTYQVLGDVDPVYAVAATYRVLRGGGWSSHVGNTRSAFRLRNGPMLLYSDIGFRLVRFD